MDIPERYVRLCLQVGRHIDGFIDAFIGPSEMQQTVAADEPVDPKHLRDEAQLLLDGLDDAHLEDDRRRWAAQPRPESKEHLGGFAVVDVPSREEALEWAAKIAVACRCAQEERELLPDPTV